MATVGEEGRAPVFSRPGSGKQANRPWPRWAKRREPPWRARQSERPLQTHSRSALFETHKEPPPSGLGTAGR